MANNGAIVGCVEKVRESDGNEAEQPTFTSFRYYLFLNYFQTLFISCASFLFAVDKQHQQMHGHGCADANLLSPPKKELIQTLQNIHKVNV